ncbi:MULTISPECIES: hypothetical protein [unclassified Bacillus (in: firmicutes)]|uniref:hypothetical protein n=1 Tax=unclassified Bacillus (in: firmicutes) TaxID=185979 RepID=UPI000BF2D0F3|nr:MULTISPECIES: hypothetical protein [unclassified Bacillus (in: firmicutes)]PET44897.1 hypothetical protein CN514_21400 [Bacillus sp. AFS001701]PGZ93965.1 hypothetical protein COE53_04390 [Bacillus sp. AFS029533]
MYLILLMVLFTIIGYFLFWLPPAIGGAIAFGIFFGILSRGVYFLFNINKRITKAYPTHKELELEDVKKELKEIKKF